MLCCSLVYTFLHDLRFIFPSVSLIFWLPLGHTRTSFSYQREIGSSDYWYNQHVAVWLCVCNGYIIVCRQCVNMHRCFSLILSWLLSLPVPGCIIALPYICSLANHIIIVMHNSLKALNSDDGRPWGDRKWLWRIFCWGHVLDRNLFSQL